MQLCPRGCESVRHHGTSGSLSTCENRAELRAEDGGRFGLSGLGEYGAAKRKVSLWAADKALRLVFHTYAWCGGGRAERGQGLGRGVSALPKAASLSVRAVAELGEIARDNGPAALDETMAKAKARLIEVAFGLKSDAGSSIAAAAG
ncbi:MAG: hypothetical protein AMXMBFR56_14790 [Polyangiaceae bacterium]